MSPLLFLFNVQCLSYSKLITQPLHLFCIVPLPAPSPPPQTSEELGLIPFVSSYSAAKGEPVSQEGGRGPCSTAGCAVLSGCRPEATKATPPLSYGRGKETQRGYTTCPGETGEAEGPGPKPDHLALELTKYKGVKEMTLSSRGKSGKIERCQVATGMKQNGEHSSSPSFLARERTSWEHWGRLMVQDQEAGGEPLCVRSQAYLDHLEKKASGNLKRPVCEACLVLRFHRPLSLQCFIVSNFSREMKDHSPFHCD